MQAFRVGATPGFWWLQPAHSMKYQVAARTNRSSETGSECVHCETAGGRTQPGSCYALETYDKHHGRYSRLAQGSGNRSGLQLRSNRWSSDARADSGRNSAAALAVMSYVIAFGSVRSGFRQVRHPEGVIQFPFPWFRGPQTRPRKWPEEQNAYKSLWLFSG